MAVQTPLTPDVYPQHAHMRAVLVHLAQGRPDLFPITRTMLALSQHQAQPLGLQAEKVAGYVMLHELGKYLTAPAPEPLRIASCDLPSGIMINRAVEAMPDLAQDALQAGLDLPAPALVIALIAWCELQVTAEGKLMTLHQRHLYMDRHYSYDHPQYRAWLALEPLALRVQALSDEQ